MIKQIKHPSPNGRFTYTNELWLSNAYQELPKAAMNLLHGLTTELRFDRFKGKFSYTNNGQISFTERQYKSIFHHSSETYIRSRNQLIKNGLVKQTYRGGYGKGDRSRYKLLFIDGVPFAQQRWRDYPSTSFESDVPKMKLNQVGQKTRFKKGRSGRKPFSTLQNRTLKCKNNPAKSNTRKSRTP